jgi:hypothetical protein
LTLEVEHGTVHQRLSLPHGFLIHQEAFVEQRGAARNHVDASDEFRHVLARDVLGEGYDPEPRIEIEQSTFGLSGSRRADASVTHENLPIEVVEPEISAVGKDKGADTGGG